MLELPLPAVNCERVGVQHDGQTCYSGVEARQVAPEAWRALDAALHPGVEGHPSSTWMDGKWSVGGGYVGEEGAAVLSAVHGWSLLPSHSSRLPTPSLMLAGGSRAARLNEADEAAAPRSCCVGEAVGLDVELHNPLQLDLAVTRLRLACTWEPTAGAAGGGGPSPDSIPPGTQSEASQQSFQVCVTGWGSCRMEWGGLAA